jgi:hypothetical protein
LLLLLACAGSLARAQAFGRFGFETGLRLPGITVTEAGIRAKNPMADRLSFAEPLAGWRADYTSPFRETVSLRPKAGCPSRIVASLLTPGVSLEFRDGFSFQLGSTQGPILTWPEGSCNPNVPTPSRSWVILSFHDDQPPLLLSLGGGAKAVFKVTGQTGAWRLSTTTPYKGWVRVVYPLGTQGRATRSAADLGKLVEAVKPDLPLWTGPAAEPKGIATQADEMGLEARWVYSGPVLVPPPVLSAPLGGYPLELKSAVKHTRCVTEEGTLTWAPGGELRVRFPVRQVPPGRPVALAGKGRPTPGSVSFIDVPSIVDLGLEALRGDRDPQTLPTADSIEQTFLDQAAATVEPVTGQKVLYDGLNVGLDVVAAHAFLNACVTCGTGNSKPDTALFTTALWRRDWWSWLPAGPEAGPDIAKAAAIGRRSAGLLAVAGALFGTAETRLQGAMFEAGLAADRARHYLETGSKLVDVLPELREALFASRLVGPPVGQVLSRVRVLSAQPIWATDDLETLVLHFAGSTLADRIALWVPADCQIEAGSNVKVLSIRRDKEACTVEIVSPHVGDATLRVGGLGASRMVAATRRVGLPDLGSYRELVR